MWRWLRRKVAERRIASAARAYFRASDALAMAEWTGTSAPPGRVPLGTAMAATQRALEGVVEDTCDVPAATGDLLYAARVHHATYAAYGAAVDRELTTGREAKASMDAIACEVRAHKIAEDAFRVVAGAPPYPTPPWVR